MRKEPIIEKFMTALPRRFEVVEEGRGLLSACVIDIDKNGHGQKIETIVINDDRPFRE
jgi:calcineurin-like phosphoesterase